MCSQFYKAQSIYYRVCLFKMVLFVILFRLFVLKTHFQHARGGVEAAISRGECKHGGAIDTFHTHL